MRVLGLRIEKICAERFNEIHGKEIELKTNFNIGEIKKEDLNKTSGNSPVFSFSFNYFIDYPDIAKISFEGKVFVSVDKKTAKELEKQGPEAISKELREVLLNFVLLRTHAESLHLEEKLGLPFHIPSPKVSIK